jgi:hypothetical protein
MSVDIKDFNTKKALGLVRVIESTDENIIVAYKSYDLEQAKLGQIVELPEQVYAQSKAELASRKTELQAQIDEIDIFLNGGVV